jgi:hypothetical protein
MRYCLGCRRLSSDTPLCTHCGRSFGGRLCHHKKGRHLNPPAAQVCGTCGSTTLTEAAEYIPVSGIARLLLGAALLAGIFWAAPSIMRWTGSATGLSHYRDPRVWFIETTAGWLMPFVTLFFVFYAFSYMVPGEGGKMMRTTLVSTTMWAVRGLLGTAGSICKGLSKLITSRVQGTKTKP